MSETHEATEPALERFVFFSDAVFAIAITLLALEIKAPNPGLDADEAAWEAALLHLTPSVGAFVLGFYVIGNIWTAHHEVFRLVRRFDARLLAPNMLLLFAVVLIPNATALMGSTTRAPAPYAVYSAVMVIAGLSKAWLTSRALRPALVGPGASREEITALTRRSWLMPAASAIALALAFVVPAWNNAAMILIAAGRLPWFRSKS